MPSIQELLNANPMFTGGLLMAAMAYLGVVARDLPAKLWGISRRAFTTSLTTNNDEYIFTRFEMFLAKHPSSKKSRKFGVAIYENEDGKYDVRMTPGDGLHLIRHKGRFILVTKETKEGSNRDGPNMSIRKTITLSILGRNRKPLDELLAEVQLTRADNDRITIHNWGGNFYNTHDLMRKRSLDTIYLRQDIKDAIVEDMRWFESRADWYRERHIPHRRGYLFQGPPGTGKTSLIKALASEFNKPIHIISPTSCDDDNSFLEALNAAGPSVVAIEDVDSFVSAHNREVAAPTPGEKKGLTLSGILNALDGVASKDGRIVILTTNRADVLDPALLRPGRIDRIFTLDHADETVAREMFARIGAPGSCDAFLAGITLPMSQAELQNRLMALVDRRD